MAKPGTVAHASVPSMWEAETGGSQVPARPEKHNEIMPPKSQNCREKNSFDDILCKLINGEFNLSFQSVTSYSSNRVIKE